MVRFRLIMLSDLHFGVRPNVKNALMALRDRKSSSSADVDCYEAKPELKKLIFHLDSHDDMAAFAAAKFCYDNRDAADAVMLTGDLACTGRTRDLRVARDFLFGTPKNFFFDLNHPYSLGRSDLIPVVLAGNHDRYCDVFGTPGCMNFDSEFADVVPDERVYVKSLRKGDKRISVVCADFTLRSTADVEEFPWPIATVNGRFGQGRVYADVLEELRKKTYEARQKSSSLIFWAIHFAPFECGSELKLVDYPKLRETALSEKVQLIVCGHTHQKSTHNFDGLHILCNGTTSCVRQDRRYFLHILDVNFSERSVSIKRENYKFDSVDRVFVHDGDDKIM